MSRYVTVVPAYGREYKSGKAANIDWVAGKDFRIEDFQLSGYINREQAVKAGLKVTLRFDRLTKTAAAK